MADGNDLAAELAHRARDAAYVAVGLGVLGFQRAQVRRHRLQAMLAGEIDVGERLTELRSLATVGARQVGELVDQAAQALESSLQPLDERLPSVARDVGRLVTEQAHVVGAQLERLLDRRS